MQRMSLRVVAMFRVSTEAQAAQGASLAAQERQFDTLAERHGWIVIAKHSGSESARKALDDRRVLQETLASIQKHDADALYVHEQSRLTRGDELDLAVLMRELRERGMKVIVSGHVRDLDSIDDRFMLRIQSVVDRAESERIVERSKRGKREKASQGLWTTGNAPFGYRNPTKQEGCRGVLQIVPEQAAIVRRIFAMVAGGDTVNSVHVAFNRDGVPTPTGIGQWGNSTLRRLLTNPAYIGTIAANRWRHDGRRITRQPAQIVVENAHEPIIERATWDRVQARMQGVRRRGAQPAMLTGLLHVNGHRLSGDTNSVAAFYCRKGGPYIRREHADGLVWDGFCRLMQSTEWISVIREQLASDENAADRQAMAEQHRATIVKLERRIEGLTAMRADGEIGKAEFTARAQTAREQIQAARSGLSACAVDSTSRSDDLQQTAIAMRALLSGNVKPTNRRRLIESVASHIEARAERHEKTRRWQIRDLRIGVMDPAQWSWASRRGSGPLQFRRQSHRCPAARTSAPD